MGIKTFVIALLFFPICVLAQDGTLAYFEEDLEEVFDMKTFEKLRDQAKELERVYFDSPTDLSYNLAPDRKWRFMFAKRSGWRQIVGQDAQDQTAYYLSDYITVLTGQEITDMFGLRGKPVEGEASGDVMVSAKPFQSTYALQTLNDNYAVVVKIHSYPNGNMTSWYVEERYYFVLDGR